MKTVKLIRTIWTSALVYLVLRFIQWCYQNYATDEVLRYWLKLVGTIAGAYTIIFLIAIAILFFIKLSEGEYNTFFSKHTDPMISKIEDFFNRRNIKK